MDTLFPTDKSTDLIAIEKGFGIKKFPPRYNRE